MPGSVLGAPQKNVSARDVTRYYVRRSCVYLLKGDYK
jgi:hypothetical protein